MNKNNGFKKIAELSDEDRKKVKGFWTDLFGAAYAEAMVKDYDTSAKTKTVSAKKK